MITYLMSITKEEHKHILWDIYDNCRDDMYFTAKSIVRDKHIAEDVVQESFERIIKKMHLIEKIPRNGLRKYTVLIVKSIAINTITKDHKYKLEPIENMEIMAGDDNESLENLVIRNEQVSVIRKCLNEIDVKYAHPMILRYYFGFSDSETADLLGVNSASTIRSLCYRGRKKILKAMKKAGDLYE